MSPVAYAPKNLRLPIETIETLGMLARQCNTSPSRVISALLLTDRETLIAQVARNLQTAERRFPMGKPGRKPFTDADREFLALSEAQKREMLGKTLK